MRTLAILSIAGLSLGSVALSQDKPGAVEGAPLLLVQEIPLPNVGGRIDHFTFDAKRKRVIGAALGNNTVEVVDTFSGRDIHSIPGAAAPQGVVAAKESLGQAAAVLLRRRSACPVIMQQIPDSALQGRVSPQFS